MLTDEDKAIREGRITATRMVMIMTGVWGGPLRAWLEIKGQAPPFEAGYLLRRGKAMEPVIAELYKDDYGEVITRAKATVHPDFNWLCATPDGYTMYGGDKCVAEIKIPYMTGKYGANETDDVPNGVLVQTSVQMSCCNVQRTINIVDKGVSLNRYIIDRSARLESVVLERAAQFWRDYIIADRTPPVDGSDAYRDYINAMYRDFTDDIAVGNDSDEKNMAEYLHIKDKITNELEPRKKQLRNKIAQSIGGYRGITAEHHEATLSRIKGREVFDRQKITALARSLGATDEQIKECASIGNPYTQLRIKEVKK